MKTDGAGLFGKNPVSRKKWIKCQNSVENGRVRRLQDLTILRPFDPAILRLPVREGLVAMTEEFKCRDECKEI